MWVKQDWDKKFMILTKPEKDTLELNYRDIFNMAQRCQEYEEV